MNRHHRHRMIRYALFLVIFVNLFPGCGAGLLNEMIRTNEDPVVISPRVSSFEEENRITVEWSEDQGADEYALYRALDAATPVWNLVYRGGSLVYQEVAVPNRERRLYRLGKIRGTKLFGPSDAVLGVGGDIRRDMHEPNETRDQATLLSYDLSSNLWFFSSYDGQESFDIDWYRVSVPPRRQANIVVTDKVNSDRDNYMSRYRDGAIVRDVVSGFAFAMANHGYAESEIFFRITPNAQTFYNQLGLAGGNIITYDISLHSITALK